MIDWLYLTPFKLLNLVKRYIIIWMNNKYIIPVCFGIAYLCIFGLNLFNSYLLAQKALMYLYAILTTPIMLVYRIDSISSFKESLKILTLQTIIQTFIKTLKYMIGNLVIYNIIIMSFLAGILHWNWIDIISSILIELIVLFLFYMLLYICYHLSHYTKTISLQIKRELSALGMLSTMLTIPLTIINFKSGVICLNITLAFLKYIDFLNEETKYRKQVKTIK